MSILTAPVFYHLRKAAGTTFLFILTFFCTVHLSAQCDLPLLSDDYSDPSLWTTVAATPGSINISGGTLNFNTLHGADYGRVLRPLPAVLPDTYWNAKCAFMPVTGNGPSHYVMAFTAGSLDPISYDASLSYSLTNQDAIMVYYIYQGGTPASGSCCQDPHFGPWQLVARSKKGNVLAAPSAGISILDLNTYSFVELERISPGLVALHAYSDSTMILDLPGSPVYYCIDSSITGLNTVQQGVVTWSGYYRELSAKIDDLNICLQRNDTIVTEGCSSALLRLNNIPSATFSWAPAVACGTCMPAVVAVPPGGTAVTYTLQIDLGCARFQKYFTVRRQAVCQEPCGIGEIPNVFTPNNDHINDEFIFTTCADGNLKIFNRWGEIVFNTDNLSSGWNGKVMNTGANAPEGTYYYLIESSGKSATGFVSLIR